MNKVKKLNELILKYIQESSNVQSNKDFIEFINSSIRNIGKIFNADRMYIFRYFWDKKITSNKFEWCNKGVEPQIDKLQNIPLNTITKWTDAHKSGEAMLIYSVDKLVDDDLKKVLSAQNIKSLFAFPIMKSNRCYGFFGLDYVEKEYKLNKDLINKLYDYQVVYNTALIFKKKNIKINNLKKEVKKLSDLDKKIISSVSHYFNTPLTLIKGNIDLLKDEIANDKYIDIIEGIEMLSDFLNMILKLSKDKITDNENKEFFNIEKLLNYLNNKNENVKYKIGKDLLIFHNRIYFYELFKCLKDIFNSLEVSIDYDLINETKLNIIIMINSDNPLIDKIETNNTSNDIYIDFKIELLKKTINLLKINYYIEENKLYLKLNNIRYKRKNDINNLIIDLNISKSKILLIDKLDMHRIILEILFSEIDIEIVQLKSIENLIEYMEKEKFDLIIVSKDQTYKKIDYIKNIPQILLSDKLSSSKNNFEDIIYWPFKKNNVYKIVNKYLKNDKEFTNMSKDSKYKNLIDEYNKVKDFQIIDKIEDFSIKLIKFGKKNNDSKIVEYGKKLKKASKNFNIAKINNLIDKFLDIIN
ncbi:MAG: hypothetical protein ACQEQE_05105 [Bacillota bacterium]